MQYILVRYVGCLCSQALALGHSFLQILVAKVKELWWSNPGRGTGSRAGMHGNIEMVRGEGTVEVTDLVIITRPRSWLVLMAYNVRCTRTRLRLTDSWSANETGTDLENDQGKQRRKKWKGPTHHLPPQITWWNHEKPVFITWCCNAIATSDFLFVLSPQEIPVFVQCSRLIDQLNRIFRDVQRYQQSGVFTVSHPHCGRHRVACQLQRNR